MTSVEAERRKAKLYNKVMLCVCVLQIEFEASVVDEEEDADGTVSLCSMYQ